MNMFQTGQYVKAAIIAIAGDTVFINLNLKSEGVIDRAEFIDQDGKLTVHEGDIIKAYFVSDTNGEMRFTTKIAGNKADSSMLEAARENNIPVEGKVEQEIKGGYRVKIGDISAFCPYSQMGGKQKKESGEYIGKTFSFIIQEYKDNGRSILVSNRAFLEMQHQNDIKELKKTLTVGATVEGTVASLQKFGAFVDIQNIQALLPISEISRQHITEVDKVLAVGQTVTVKIISVDWETERMAISMKALTEDPWKTAAAKYTNGSKHSGNISRIAPFGLFVQLEPGLDGLVHISEIKDIGRTTNLAKKFSIGQRFDVVIKEVNESSRRISLAPSSSTEQDTSAAKYMVGQDDDEGYNPFATLLKT